MGVEMFIYLMTYFQLHSTLQISVGNRVQSIMILTEMIQHKLKPECSLLNVICL